MNRRTRIMALYADLRALLRQEIKERGESGEPDSLDEAQWALTDSEAWYLGTQDAVAVWDARGRRVDANIDAALPDDVRKDAERWAVVKSLATCGTLLWGDGYRHWGIGALSFGFTDFTQAIDAEIKRRSEQ